MTDKNVEAVIAKHRERAAKGLLKYGVTTERGDLTPEDWLRHLQEELMDAAVYIEARLSADDALLRKAMETLSDWADVADAIGEDKRDTEYQTHSAPVSRFRRARAVRDEIRGVLG